MNLKSLLLSADEKTVRVLRRVLSDLEIDVVHCGEAEDALRRITRQRYEAIIVDVAEAQGAGDLLVAAKASPVNNRALAIVLVEAVVGMKGGFGMGAHFVLHKPLAVERAKSSFRAVRALMKRERRLQVRVPVQIPVECFGAGRYKATTVDLSEGGMAIRFMGRAAKENSLRFSFELPGTATKFEIQGELAWEGNDQVGVRFKDAAEDQRKALRQWLDSNTPEMEQDDPPVDCRLTDLSLGGCYVTTSSPFPRGTSVTLSIKTGEMDARARGIVLVTHPEHGMGVEFLQATSEQREKVKNLVSALRSSLQSAGATQPPEVQVEPQGLEAASAVAAGSGEARATGMAESSANDDALVSLFRAKFEMPMEIFMAQMREKRQSVAAR